MGQAAIIPKTFAVLLLLLLLCQRISNVRNGWLYLPEKLPERVFFQTNFVLFRSFFRLFLYFLVLFKYFLICCSVMVHRTVQEPRPRRKMENSVSFPFPAFLSHILYQLKIFLFLPCFSSCIDFSEHIFHRHVSKVVFKKSCFLWVSVALNSHSTCVHFLGFQTTLARPAQGLEVLQL